MKKNYFILLFVFVTTLSSTTASAQDGFIGEVRMFAGNFAPRGWEFCQGQMLAIASNTALFSILGTTYGGDGRSTFALPDLKGRVAIQPGSGGGLSSYSLGQRGGAEFNTITIAQMPSHNHLVATTASAQNVLLSTDPGVNSTPAAGDVPAAARFGNGLGATPVKSYGPATNTVNGQAIDVAAGVYVGNAGGNQQLNNLQPYLSINYIICVYGVFPSRS